MPASTEEEGGSAPVAVAMRLLNTFPELAGISPVQLRLRLVVLQAVNRHVAKLLPFVTLETLPLVAPQPPRGNAGIDDHTVEPAHTKVR